MGLTETVKAEARRLGFDLAGVTTPQPPDHFSVFLDWLEAGRHGEMAYLSTERSTACRLDPRQILPDSRSILMLGICYPAPPAADHPDQEQPAGPVAAYARGADYHEVLVPRLAALVRFIETQVGHAIPNRYYTDTGPIMERDLAQRAGLGWIGKNTCLIHPHLGSYFLLAEVLLGIELEPDLPFESDRCGSCTRCLEACPTNCILPDRTIDASRCISYLTIELKGPIPAGLRTKMGEWVFGCDVCQQVCPWNQRFAVSPGDPAFAARPDYVPTDLTAELRLTPAEYNRKYRGSPLKRPKRRGHLRNVAIALGNKLARGERSALPALIEALRNEPDALVRSHAAWALSQAAGEQARMALEQAFEAEKDEAVLQEIRTALEKSSMLGS